MDALIAAPEHHTLLLENERVRVLQTLIPPGATTGMHTHRWPCVIHTISTSHYLRRNGDGVVIQDSRSEAPSPLGFRWSSPMPPHSIENVGDSDIRLILTEFKEAPRS
jgi:hypothetical protein